MDKRKNYYLVLDTETANGLDDPLVYDCGFAVVDKKGNVYETHSYIIYEIYRGERELMQSAYYAAKIPMYEEQIAAGLRKIVKYITLRKIIREVCERWNIKAIIAHNMSFDYRATSKTQRFLTSSKYRYFFPYGIPVWCTKCMAQDTIAKQKSYIAYCEERGYMYNGRPRVTAEILFRYLSGQHDFEEEHTGLADVLIEKVIFTQCMRQHKPMRKSPYKEKTYPYAQYEADGWEMTEELLRKGKGTSLLDELVRQRCLKEVCV